MRSSPAGDFLDNVPEVRIPTQLITVSPYF